LKVAGSGRNPDTNYNMIMIFIEKIRD
jgi:hypothetical protein